MPPAPSPDARDGARPPPGASAEASARRSRRATVIVGLAVLAGALAGGFFPKDTHPVAFTIFLLCSKTFLALVKSVIVPILVATLITGIAQTGDLKAVGRLGGKSLLYFEVVTTLALVVGLVVGNVLRPGDGLPLDVTGHTELAHPKPFVETLLHAFPSNVVKHAAEGDILPVVVFATLFAVALVQVGERGKPVLAFFDGVAHVMFRYTALVMKLTPVGVFGAMAYNTSTMAAGHGAGDLRGWPAVLHLLGSYAKLVGSLYLALALFFALVLVPIMLVARVPVRRFFRAIQEPVVTAFTTASSEAALPKLLENLERFGVPRHVASFVVPAGYSFNLDGSTLYLVLASLTIAQAAKIDMPLSTQIAMMLTFMLTSKGVAGVPRATLVIIAGTCGSFGLPGEAGVAMILAVDELMDMARSAVNLTGNGLAAAVMARSEGYDLREPPPEALDATPEAELTRTPTSA